MYNIQESATVLHASPATARSHLVPAANNSSNFPGEIVGSAFVRASRSKPRPGAPAAYRMAASLEYMLAHLNQPMKISTLSAMAGFSKSRFFELFKSATGDTPINWFIRARMQRAGELLAHTNLRIKQIAWQVGYEDQFYFSRLFRAVHGMSPSEYRARFLDSLGNAPAISHWSVAASSNSTRPLAPSINPACAAACSG